ncbi:MAG: MASE3 domain-containing protein [Desulfococcaceae bacterium]|jgi:signal transduction histidine kinase|nr:MASE3 domain-containing protein [Desulfococcaceae bacterium]
MTYLKKIILFSVWPLILIALYGMSCYNYLLFHTVVEMFVIAVVWAIFLVVWNARHVMENGYLLFMGTGYFFVGVLDLLHVMAYKGMNIFYGFDANLPTQLWIAWQYLLALSLLGGFFFISGKIKAEIILTAFAFLVFTLVWLIFAGYFPDCFREGSGLTLFKKYSEIFTSFMLLACLPLFQKYRSRFSGKVIRLLSISTVFAVAAKTAFIFYVSVYGISNLLGHYLLVISVFFLYRAVVETGISDPTALLFRELKSRETELEISRNSLKNVSDDLEKQVKIRTKELEQANIQLLAEIEERTFTEELLQQKNRELEQTNRHLDDFAYTVSHDLREPLRGLFGYAVILREDEAEKLSEKSRYMLERICALATRQDEQISAILRYSRIGRQRLRLQPADMDAVVWDVIRTLKLKIHENRTEIRIPRSLPSVCCDRELIAEVFQNLISNALKYNDKDDKWIEISFRADNADIPFFYVRDNGIGIAEKDYDTVFKIFRRLHKANEFQGGTGAGLCIVKKIIEHHSGKIWIESCPGAGSTFYFTLCGTKKCLSDENI